MQITNSEIVHGIQKYFLLAVLVLLIIVLFVFLSPFVPTLLIAGVIVTAVYPGSSTEDVEKLVAIPIERKLTEVDGIDENEAIEALIKVIQSGFGENK